MYYLNTFYHCVNKDIIITITQRSQVWTEQLPTQNIYNLNCMGSKGYDDTDHRAI